jgi:acyl-coenzyme A synthetase/AMP-(fatty) acid ligase
LLAHDGLVDHIGRGNVRHVVCGAQDTEKFAELPGEVTRTSVGGAVPGWIDYAEAYTSSADFAPDAETGPDDPLLLYFTSGTTSKPKLVEHTHQSYPVGHLSTMYWIWLKRGDVHLNFSSPGWARHAWSCFFAPWNAGATVFVYKFGRFRAKAVLETRVRCGVTTLCAPPTVRRMLIREDEDGYYTDVVRADDVFTASDYRISPFELESVLMEHEAVAEAAAVPSPDPVRLAVPKAVVSPVAGREPCRDLAFDILRFARERLAPPYKRVRRLEFAELPKTISGKIRRVELRKREADLRAEETRRPMEFWEDDFFGR